ncbi:hypothetical protein BDQ17DRAFT_882158 [Cyathus striatus]|nr:hypothetical protein BDQ17DRAFT_882158 [Cyathus striatus]
MDSYTSDTSFSLFLINEDFNDSFAIANNVDPSLQTITLTIPSVPVRDGYTLRATNPGNITDVFAETGSFSVGATTSTSSIASSTAASQSGSSTVSGSGSGTVSASATSTRPVGSSSSFGVTVSNSASTSGGSASSSALRQVLRRRRLPRHSMVLPNSGSAGLLLGLRFCLSLPALPSLRSKNLWAIPLPPSSYSAALIGLLYPLPFSSSIASYT